MGPGQAGGALLLRLLMLVQGKSELHCASASEAGETALVLEDQGGIECCSGAGDVCSAPMWTRDPGFVEPLEQTGQTDSQPTGKGK